MHCKHYYLTIFRFFTSARCPHIIVFCFRIFNTHLITIEVTLQYFRPMVYHIVLQFRTHFLTLFQKFVKYAILSVALCVLSHHSITILCSNNNYRTKVWFLNLHLPQIQTIPVNRFKTAKFTANDLQATSTRVCLKLFCESISLYLIWKLWL